MTMLILGMLVFCGVHLLRVAAPGYRERMIARLGPAGWKGAYALASLAGFALIVIGYAGTRWSSPVLWGPSLGGLRMAVGLAMLPVLVVFISAYLPGRLRAALRHPMMLATAVWAALHLLVNGRVADLVLFGGFLAWALVVLADSYRRPWKAPAQKPSLLWDVAAIVLGGVAWWWLAFGSGHALLFGIPVM